MGIFEDMLREAAETDHFFNELYSHALSFNSRFPLCLRTLLARKTVSLDFAAEIIKSCYSDDSIEKLADYFIEAGLCRSQADAEVMATEKLNELSDLHDPKCRQALGRLMPSLQDAVRAQCCACCPKACEDNGELAECFKANTQTLHNEYEFSRLIYFYRNKLKDFLPASDSMFHGLIDSGDHLAVCIFADVYHSIITGEIPDNELAKRYLVNLSSDTRPVDDSLMANIIAYQENADELPDLIYTPHINLANLTVVTVLESGDVANLIVRIRMFGIVAVEAALTDDELSFLVYDYLSQAAVIVRQRDAWQLLSVIASKNIIKISFFPLTLNSVVRAVQQASLWEEERLSGVRNIFRLRQDNFTSESHVIPETGYGYVRSRKDFRKGSFPDQWSDIEKAYDLVLSAYNSNGILGLSPFIEDVTVTELFLSWYGYIPNIVGQINGRSPQLRDAADEGTPVDAEIIGASFITVQFQGNGDIKSCILAFERIAHSKGICTWANLALVTVYDNGLRFACDKSSTDYFLDLIHGWAERSVAEAGSADVEVVVFASAR